MAKVKDIMTKNVVTVNTGTPVSEATELLMKRNITGMPVVEEDMTLVGVITEKDVLKLFYASGHTCNRTVSDFMTTPAVSFDENDDLRDVCNCLMDNYFRRVPVTSSGKVVGIISRHDVLDYMYKAEAEEDAAAEHEKFTSVGANDQ